jgi:DNA-binding beta-propeller fold protein YncE
MKWTSNYTAGGVCIAGCSGTTGLGANQLNSPRDLRFDSEGNLYVSDQGNNRIQKFEIQLSSSNCSVSK